MESETVVSEKVEVTSPSQDIKDETKVDDGAVEKTKEVETDTETLEKRAKQIEVGKNTPEYQRYVQEVPITERGLPKVHPRTPDLNRKYSNRLWDGLVKSWRRSLLKWNEVENDEKELSKRLKHLTATKSTKNYQKYSKEVPKDQRVAGKHPMTPDHTVKYESQQVWLKKINAWREGLANFQPDFDEVEEKPTDGKVVSAKNEGANVLKSAAKPQPIVFDLDGIKRKDDVKGSNGVKSVEDQKPKRKPIVFDIQISENEELNEIDIILNNAAAANKGSKQGYGFGVNEVVNEPIPAMSLRTANPKPEFGDLRMKMAPKPRPQIDLRSARGRSRSRSRRSRSSGSSSGSPRRDKRHRHRRSRSRTPTRQGSNPIQSLAGKRTTAQYPAAPNWIPPNHPWSMPPPPVIHQQQPYSAPPSMAAMPPQRVPPPNFPPQSVAAHVPKPMTTFHQTESPSSWPTQARPVSPVVLGSVFPANYSPMQPTPLKGLDFAAIVHMNPGEEMLRYVQSKCYDYARELDSKHPDLRRLVGRIVDNSKLNAHGQKILPCGAFNKNDGCPHKGLANFCHPGPVGVSIHACTLCYFSLGGLFNFHRQTECPLLETVYTSL